MRHPRRSSALIPVLALSFAIPLGAPGQAITDDFTSYPSGSAAAPEWTTASGFWYVADGTICENSGAYDTGLFSTEYRDGAYEASVRFRVEDGHRGAGFLFNSASASDAAYAHMVRLSDAEVLHGYLEGGEYHALGILQAPVDLGPGSWHVFVLRVDPDAGTYGFAIDGTTLAEGLPLRYRTGYVGIQNSGGHACFDDFELESRDLGARARLITWPQAVSAGPQGSVWVGSGASGTVRRFSAEGRVLAELGAAETRVFVEPTATGTLPDGDLVVLDAGTGRLHRYDAEGTWRATGGGGLEEPADLAVGSDGTIAVSDPSRGRIVFFDRELRERGELGWDGPYEPGPIAMRSATLAFVDRDAGAVHLLDGRGTEWTRRATFYAPPGPIRGIELGADGIFLAVASTVHRFDSDGNEVATLDLGMLDRFLPRDLAIDGEELHIADFVGDRIVSVDAALTSPLLRHAFSDDGLELSWTSGMRTSPRLEVSIGDRLWAEDDGPPATEHRFVFDGIEPSTLYRVRYTPGIRAIPEDDALSREVVLMSPPEPGQTHFQELRGAVVLFANVVDTTRAGDEWPEQPPLEQSEIDRIVAQVEDGRRFFWMNSGMRLHLALDYYIVEDAKEWRDVFVDLSYYPPRTDLGESVLRDGGGDISDYESLLYLVVVRDFDPDTGEWDVRGPGGAFTQGFGWSGRYGRSWWEVTREDHSSGNNWLVVHEFHHQLDELFMHSGYPEYWFNHFSPHIGTSARFGEHFDGNAHILREWPGDRYFDLDFGRLAFAADADGDGIPDDAPHLPMDEVRLGSRPDAVDSSGDGMTDREVLALSNWVAEGVGESYGAPARFPDPLVHRGSGEGVAGDASSDPALPFPSELARDEFTEIGGTADARAPHRIEVSWNADSLFIRFDAPPDRHLKVLVDANADGWFVGRDNIHFELDTESMAERVDVFHAGRGDAWARMDGDLAGRVGQSWDVVDGFHQLSIPRNPELGLILEEGETIGLVFGVSIPEVSPQRRRFITVHEPNRFIYLRLSG